MSSPSSQVFLDALHSPGFVQLMSDMMREGRSAYWPDTQFDDSPVHLDLNKPMSVWLLVGLLHPHHTCWVLPGTYRLWSLRVCRLLQCHLHRLCSQASQQHQGRPAELHVVEGAASEAICSYLILYG
ncbi:hypothetical protein PIB30_012631 [Stylosanthes scabra]|uniref:Uncharacterized protein n=1 Tax=Stylosanthes scabra TaxID=79078 RepID=A0ABU6Y6D9_9FABA|nr:hypothetical protein [Stylosanthes scabra]